MQEKSHRKCPETACPSGVIISKLVKKVSVHGTLIERRPLKRNRVVTEEKHG
jgi:hypothetical protein